MRGWKLGLTLVLAVASPTFAADAPPKDLRDFIPSSISPLAQTIYDKMLPRVRPRWDKHNNPKTAEDFQRLHDADVTGSIAASEASLKALNVTVTEMKLDGIDVVETRPPHYQDDGTVILRVHGGGFYLGSARSSVAMDAMIGIATGKRMLSIDYATVPKGNWKLVTDQVVAVYRAVLKQGHLPKSIGLLGDSAGGNIVAASMLKARDLGLPLPGALVLFSPCIDFAQTGDTNMTLRAADPAIDEIDIAPGLEAYASRTEWKNPYVSPIYGDFSKGFPPTLLQVGTKEVLLSDSVRLYQAIKGAGGEAELDVYEGMAHVFQAYMVNTPEQKAALKEVGRFWSQHLVPSKK